MYRGRRCEVRTAERLGSKTGHGKQKGENPELEKNRYDMILDLIPDGILAVDREGNITDLNLAARRILGIPEERQTAGTPVREVMDVSGFVRLRDGQRASLSERVPLADSSRVMEYTYLCDREKSIFLCLIREVTQLCVRQELQEKGRQRAIELADAMKEKHLRLVQDIAGLLGEDAAEMQVALSELKRAVLSDGEKQDA